MLIESMHNKINNACQRHYSIHTLNIYHCAVSECAGGTSNTADQSCMAAAYEPKDTRISWLNSCVSVLD